MRVGESQLSADLRSLLSALADTPETLLPAKPFQPGDRVGRYELREEIGRGGFGIVFEAHDQELDRFVAIKLTRVGHGGLEAFRREAQAVARLSHPNVVVVHDFGVFEQVPFIVMERLRGETLDVKRRRASLPMSEALAIVADVARGLVHAHQAGLTHRDIKPSNVFVTTTGQVKVLDFGLAQSPAGGGTPAFMAPEQWREQPSDARTDVFGLGLLLFFALTGESAFRVVDKRSTVLDDEPTPPLIGFPAAVARLVAGALEKAPERRFQTAGEFLGALEAARFRPRRRWWWAAGLLAVAVAYVAVARHQPARVHAAQVTSTRVIDYAARCGSDPSFAPDDNTLVYAGVVEGDWELLALDLTTRAQRRLTHDAGWDYAPAVSPDGRRVAYLHVAETTELRLLALDGAGPPLVLGATTARPAWSPSGQLLASDRDGGELDEWSLAPSPRPRRFARLPDGAVLERMSAYRDGTVVAEWRPAPTVDAIVLGELREREPPRVLVDDLDPPTALAVDRAQSGFYFGVLKTPSVELSWVPRVGGDSERLPSVIAPQSGVTFTSDGKRLVFSTCAQNLSIARLRSHQPPELITRPATQDCCASRLDGNRLLLSSKRSGDLRLWTLDPRTGETRVIGPDGSTFGAASPDGSRLVYQGKHDELWTQSLAGGDGRRLSSGHHDSWPQFTFDGRSVLFLRALEDGLHLFIVGADGGEPRQLVRERVAALSASRTADRVAVLISSDEGLRAATIEVKKGIVEPLGHIPPGAYQSVRLSPDGKRLLLATQTEVFEAGLEGAAPVSRWKATVENVGSVDYAPDGDGIVAELGAYDGDLWLAEGSFR